MHGYLIYIYTNICLKNVHAKHINDEKIIRYAPLKIYITNSKTGCSDVIWTEIDIYNGYPKNSLPNHVGKDFIYLSIYLSAIDFWNLL